LITQPTVCDSAKGVVQSVTELCIAKEGNKKPVAKARASCVEEVEKIIKVSNIQVEVGDVSAENTFETTVVDVNKDRLIWTGLRNVLTDMKLLLLHKNLQLSGDNLMSLKMMRCIIRNGKMGKWNSLQELKPPYLFVKPKKGYANAIMTFHWLDKKTAQIFEVSEELATW